MTPWLKGDPNGTLQLLTAGAQVNPVVHLFALGTGAEFETERGNYEQARVILSNARKLDDARLLKSREAKLRAALGDFAGVEQEVLGNHPWDGREIGKLKVIHPLSLNALGEAYAASGFHEQAIAIYTKSLKESRHEAQDEWAEAKVLSAFSRIALGDLPTALADAEEALSFARKRWGAFGPRTLDAADAIGMTLLAQGKLQEADQWLVLALDSRRTLYNQPHPKTAASLLHVARSLVVRKDYPHALQFTDSALGILEIALPAANARTAFALVEAAEIYVAAGRQTDARQNLEFAVHLLATLLGDDAPSVRALHRRLR